MEWTKWFHHLEKTCSKEEYEKGYLYCDQTVFSISQAMFGIEPMASYMIALALVKQTSVIWVNTLYDSTRGNFHLQGLSVIQAWISNYIHYINMGWNHLSILKHQRCNLWSLWVDKSFYPTCCRICDYISMLWSKLIHVSKRCSSKYNMVKTKQYNACCVHILSRRIW